MRAGSQGKGGSSETLKTGGRSYLGGIKGQKGRWKGSRKVTDSREPSPASANTQKIGET